MYALSQLLSQLATHPLFLPALIVCLVALAGGIVIVWARMGSGAPDPSPGRDRRPESKGR